MKKIKDFFSKTKIEVTFFVLLSYLVKVLCLNASYADSIIILGLSGLYAYRMYLRSREPKVTADAKMREEIKELKNALSKVNLSSTLNNTKRYF